MPECNNKKYEKLKNEEMNSFLIQEMFIKYQLYFKRRQRRKETLSP